MAALKCYSPGTGDQIIESQNSEEACVLIPELIKMCSPRHGLSSHDPLLNSELEGMCNIPPLKYYF